MGGRDVGRYFGALFVGKLLVLSVHMVVLTKESEHMKDWTFLGKRRDQQNIAIWKRGGQMTKLGRTYRAVARTTQEKKRALSPERQTRH